MRAIVMSLAIAGFILSFGANSFGFNQDDFLEELLYGENTWESDEFKMLGGMNDEALIEMKVNLTNRRQSHISRIAEVIVKNDFQKPSKYDQLEIDKEWNIVHKCSEIEDQIRLIIKARRLWENKHKEDTNNKQFAEKHPIH